MPSISDTGLMATPHNELEARHEADVKDGKQDIKYVFAFKNLDWDAYHLYRPVYPESMWAMWFNYHKSHNGVFGTAHDIGAGEQLAPKGCHLHRAANADENSSRTRNRSHCARKLLRQGARV